MQINVDMCITKMYCVIEKHQNLPTKRQYKYFIVFTFCFITKITNKKTHTIGVICHKILYFLYKIKYFSCTWNISPKNTKSRRIYCLYVAATSHIILGNTDFFFVAYFFFFLNKNKLYHYIFHPFITPIFIHLNFSGIFYFIQIFINRQKKNMK